jgi:hypothetical protein
VDIDTIHDGIFSGETAFKRGFQGQKGKKRAMRRDVRRLLAPKPTPRKALRLPIGTAAARSNIGSQINHFVEQNA